MVKPSAEILVAAGSSHACLKLIGRATFQSSVHFKKVVEGLRRRGATRFVLDLSECLTMDSTFLGVLAGFVQRVAKAPSGGRVELFQANPRVLELLENLGVLPLFQMADAAAATGCFKETAAEPSSKVELTQTSIEAHQKLMEINPANVPKFKDVVRFLQEDLGNQ